MRFTGKIASFVVPLVATALLTACAGGGGSPALQPGDSAAGLQAHATTNAQSAASRGIADIASHAKCKSSGSVKASPCPIALTVLDPVQTITVTAGSGDTITEKDNCAKNGIAVVAGADGSYVVTAGLAAGSCVAKFSAKNGKKHDGKASVPISNTL